MKRPRLLYLAYAFPPLNTVGCGRAWNTAMYLSRLEWDVTVVTPDPSLWQKVEDASGVNLRIEQEGLRRILTGHAWRGLNHTYLRRAGPSRACLGAYVVKRHVAST